MEPGEVTLTPAAMSFWRTMSAKPLPYAEASSMTATDLACSVLTMKVASAGPWASSLATARWKIVHPMVDRSVAVAEAVMIGRPAWLKIGSAALDSPEKAGPIMATTLDSPTALVARAGAWDGSPWLSKGVYFTWQLGFLASNWEMASCSP